MIYFKFGRYPEKGIDIYFKTIRANRSIFDRKLNTSWLITAKENRKPIKKESADKPGSVEGNHSSGLHVTMHLKQPTREQRGPRIMSPYLVLLRVGFTMPQTVTRCAVRSYRTISPLPALE